MLTADDIDALFTFDDLSSGARGVRLAESYLGEWADERRLIIYATNTPAFLATANGEVAGERLVGGSGLALSVRHTQTQLRLRGSAPPWLGASAPVTTRHVRLASCFAANETSPQDALVPSVSFVAPVELSATRVVCLAPPRTSPVLTDLDIALNGQDYHSNGLQFVFYVQPTALTRITPFTAGPTLGGSVVTIHGEGLDAFTRWGAAASNARCRWHGVQITIPSYINAQSLVCESAAQPFTAPTDVSLDIALNDRDFVKITDATRLTYTYYVQPQYVRSIHPTGGRVDGGTVVTITGGGFIAYPGVNLSDVRIGWGDTQASNLTVPRRLHDERLMVGAYPAAGPGAQQLFLSFNRLNLLPINASFLYYEQPSNFTGWCVRARALASTRPRPDVPSPQPTPPTPNPTLLETPTPPLPYQDPHHPTHPCLPCLPGGQTIARSKQRSHRRPDARRHLRHDLRRPLRRLLERRRRDSLPIRRLVRARRPLRAASHRMRDAARRDPRHRGRVRLP